MVYKFMDDTNTEVRRLQMERLKDKITSQEILIKKLKSKIKALKKKYKNIEIINRQDT